VNFGLLAVPGMLAENGWKPHQHADFARARRRVPIGLDRRGRYSPDAARPRFVEWLSAAPAGYRRLSGTVVRGLPRAQPLRRVWALPPLRRGFGVLDQSRDP